MKIQLSSAESMRCRCRRGKAALLEDVISEFLCCEMFSSNGTWSMVVSEDNSLKIALHAVATHSVSPIWYQPVPASRLMELLSQKRKEASEEDRLMVDDL